jgi:NAD(P)-dependent dehydrogenase (short-subunit alcohol dehydrogenase family)
VHIDLTGKVVMVTGAAKGIGRALAVGLAREGASVAVLARHKDQADDTAEEITRLGLPGDSGVLPVAADLTDEEEIAAAVARIDRTWGRIDCLVNNAAWMPPPTPVLDSSAADLRRVLDTNVVGCFLITKHVAPVMIRAGGGRIVYITSMTGVSANVGMAAYGATKAGVNILNNVVHRELSAKGIRTAALAPGLTDTPGLREAFSDEYIDRIAATYPGGRIGQPEDILPLVAFLCSDAARHISGTLLPVRPPAA